MKTAHSFSYVLPFFDDEEHSSTQFTVSREKGVVYLGYDTARRMVRINDHDIARVARFLHNAADALLDDDHDLVKKCCSCPEHTQARAK